MYFVYIIMIIMIILGEYATLSYDMTFVAVAYTFIS